jgi:hypothetical protein
MRRAKRAGFAKALKRRKFSTGVVQGCAGARSHATEQSGGDRHEAKHFSRNILFGEPGVKRREFSGLPSFGPFGTRRAFVFSETHSSETHR